MNDIDDEHFDSKYVEFLTELNIFVCIYSFVYSKIRRNRILYSSNTKDLNKNEIEYLELK